MGEITAVFATTHAPQLLIRPKATEDPEEVARTHAAMGQLGRRLDASGAQVIVMIGNDHVENSLDQVVAPFIVYTGEEVAGEFGPYHPRYRVDRELAETILNGMLEAGTDLAYSQRYSLDHSFVVPLRFIHPENRLPIVPIVVNAYLAPQPSPARCYRFGETLRSILLRSDRRIAIIASGGMSHFPGTPKYPHPDFDFDRKVLDLLAHGEGAKVRQFSPKVLDETGNVELLTWMVAMGIVGEETPAHIVNYEPCWHHGQGVLYWHLEKSRVAQAS